MEASKEQESCVFACFLIYPAQITVPGPEDMINSHWEKDGINKWSSQNR